VPVSISGHAALPASARRHPVVSMSRMARLCGIAPKNVPERLRHRYAGRGQLTVLSAAFDLTGVAKADKEHAHAARGRPEPGAKFGSSNDSADYPVLAFGYADHAERVAFWSPGRRSSQGANHT
jgi:hypothetical protein